MRRDARLRGNTLTRRRSGEREVLGFVTAKLEDVGDEEASSMAVSSRIAGAKLRSSTWSRPPSRLSSPTECVSMLLRRFFFSEGEWTADAFVRNFFSRKYGGIVAAPRTGTGT